MTSALKEGGRGRGGKKSPKSAVKHYINSQAEGVQKFCRRHLWKPLTAIRCDRAPCLVSNALMVGKPKAVGGGNSRPCWRLSARSNSASVAPFCMRGGRQSNIREVTRCPIWSENMVELTLFWKFPMWPNCTANSAKFPSVKAEMGKIIAKPTMVSDQMEHPVCPERFMGDKIGNIP